MIELPTLSQNLFQVVDDFLSLTFAIFLGGFVFFLVSRREIAPKYRTAVTLSAVILAVAGYHYFRIFESWNAAYALTGGEYVATGVPFNEAYRYMDWIVTVPLLIAELVLILGLISDRRRSLLMRLVPAAFAMIALGYPGELTTSTTWQWVWWAAAMVPFVYILYVLFGEVQRQISQQPEGVRGLVSALRWVLVGTWLFYPVAYLFPIVFGNTGGALAAENIGYAVADITAKALYGVLIHEIAKRKTEIEGSDARADHSVAAAA